MEPFNAIRAPSPPLEPPGLILRCLGLHVLPKTWLNVSPIWKATYVSWVHNAGYITSYHQCLRYIRSNVDYGSVGFEQVDQAGVGRRKSAQVSGISHSQLDILDIELILERHRDTMKGSAGGTCKLFRAYATMSSATRCSHMICPVCWR